jgi:DNA processing protein
VTDTEACLALNMIPGLGPVRLQALLGVFDSPQRVLAAGRNALKAVQGIGAETADALANWEKQVDLAAEIGRIEAFGAKVIHWESPEYPGMLRSIPNPPIVLYVWGDLRAEDTQAIGIVGSRSVTHYGVESAKKLSYQLAFSGYTVISGLARGIDTAAHQGALAAKGRTIAVIGSGLSKLYPPENQGLAERITESGAVVSEYPMERPADRQTFPYRNRIVAGWSRGLLVVEAGLNSGALITANQAIEQGRPVYAVPGPIDRPTSAGSNRLIQQGARLVTSADDIFDDLGSLFPGEQKRLSKAPAHEPSAPTSAKPSPTPAKLSQEETLLVTALEVGELSLDELSAATRLPTYKVSSTLTMLELKRLVRALPGQRFARRGAES